MAIISDVLRFLCCPDDNSKVALRNGFLECLTCKRRYTILAENLLEMLPSNFPSWNLNKNEPQEAERMYLKEFKQRFRWDKTSGAWGDLTNAHPSTRSFYVSEMKKTLELLNPSADGFAIDVSGAVGNYARFLSNKVKIMVNCDLHTPSILTANNHKKSNLLCVRAPYLLLPFTSDTFDYAICTDTLIRGWNHEVKLLKQIQRILKIGGKAVVDFHNQRWFAKNKNICSYNQSEIKRLFMEAGIEQYIIYSFGYVPANLVPYQFLYPVLDSIFKYLLPPKRHIIIFTKALTNKCLV